MHNTSEILNTAADLIEERGWISGPFGWPSNQKPEGSPLCLEGGILAALGIMADGFGEVNDLRQCPAYRAVASYLNINPDDDFARVYDYNDEPGRRASEVIATLRAAALIEAAREEQDAAWTTYAGCVTA